MNPNNTLKFSITSPAFKHEGMIPSKYTCDGEDVSPALSWTGAPANTKSFAIISDDPDAPMGTWVHWIIYNIPVSVTSLPEAVPQKESLDNGALQAITSFRSIGYGGPCPPSGTHRYYFKIYALDMTLNLKPKETTKETLVKTMQNHILAQAEIMGKYKRK